MTDISSPAPRKYSRRKDGKIYHLKECRFAAEASVPWLWADRFVIHTGTPTELATAARAVGVKACEVCKP